MILGSFNCSLSSKLLLGISGRNMFKLWGPLTQYVEWIGRTTGSKCLDVTATLESMSAQGSDCEPK